MSDFTFEDFQNRRWRWLNFALPSSRIDIAVLEGLFMKESQVAERVPQVYLDIPNALALGVFARHMEDGTMQGAPLPWAWNGEGLLPVHELVAQALNTWNDSEKGMIMNFLRLGAIHFVACLAQAGQMASQNFTLFVGNNVFQFPEMRHVLSSAERRGGYLLYGRSNVFADDTEMDGDAKWDDACRRYHLNIRNPFKYLFDRQAVLQADIPFIFKNGAAAWVRSNEAFEKAAEILVQAALEPSVKLQDGYFAEFLGQLGPIVGVVGVLFKVLKRAAFFESSLVKGDAKTNEILLWAFSRAADTGGENAYSALSFYLTRAQERVDLLRMISETLWSMRPLTDFAVASLIRAFRGTVFRGTRTQDDEFAQVLWRILGSVRVKYTGLRVPTKTITLPVSQNDRKRQKVAPPPSLPNWAILEGLPPDKLAIILTSNPIISLSSFASLNKKTGTKVREAAQTPGFFEAYVARTFPRLAALSATLRVWIGPDEYDAKYNSIMLAVGNSKEKAKDLVENWAWREVFVSALVQIAEIAVFAEFNEYETFANQATIQAPEQAQFLEKIRAGKVLTAQETFSEEPWYYLFEEVPESQYTAQVRLGAGLESIGSAQASIPTWSSTEFQFPSTLRDALAAGNNRLDLGTLTLPETSSGFITCGGAVSAVAEYEFGAMDDGVWNVPVALHVTPAVGVVPRYIPAQSLARISESDALQQDIARLMYKTVLPGLPERLR